MSQHTNMFKTSYSTLKNHRNRSVSSQMFSKNGIGAPANMISNGDEI